MQIESWLSRQAILDQIRNGLTVDFKDRSSKLYRTCNLTLADDLSSLLLCGGSKVALSIFLLPVLVLCSASLCVAVFVSPPRPTVKDVCLACVGQAVALRSVESATAEMPRMAPRTVLNQLKVLKRRAVLLSFKSASSSKSKRSSAAEAGLDLMFQDARTAALTLPLLNLLISGTTGREKITRDRQSAAAARWAPTQHAFLCASCCLWTPCLFLFCTLVQLLGRRAAELERKEESLFLTERQRDFELRMAKEVAEEERAKQQEEHILFNAERDVRRIMRRLVRQCGDACAVLAEKSISLSEMTPMFLFSTTIVR